MPGTLTRSTGLVYAAFAAVAAISLSAGISRARSAGERRVSTTWQAARIPAERGGAWVGSNACKACHPSEHASWDATFHRTMTQRVSPESVIAAFDGRTLDDGRFEHKVERRGDEFWVFTIDPEWLLKRAFEGPEAVSATPPASWQRVVMSTGAHSMQMYWVPAGEGNRLLAFAFAWSVEGQRWVPNESTLLRPTEPYVVYGWNDVCIKCHAVAGEPGFDKEAAAGARVSTKVAELGIACEACHGPGAQHVAAQQNPWRRYAARLGAQAVDDMLDPGSITPRAASEVCAQCHSASLAVDEDAWLRRGSGYRAGGVLEQDINVVRHPARANQPWIDATLDVDPDYLAGRFWGDGMVRISGRDFNGMRESPCYADENFGCTTCHAMHNGEVDDQLRPEAKDNRACLACHDALAKSPAALERHTRHAADGVGSQCVNCHMPHTSYGLLKAIRSHEISTPSAHESVDYGRPNACNICHLDRSLAWTAAELSSGWGITPPADALDQTPAGPQWLVAGDAGQRALAAWYFGWAPAQATAGTHWMAPLLTRELDDPYAAVRWVTLRSLRTLHEFAGVGWEAATPVHAPEAAAEFAKRLAAQAELAAPQPGSDHVGPLMRDGHFDLAAYQALRSERDERIVDLRE